MNKAKKLKTAIETFVKELEDVGHVGRKNGEDYPIIEIADSLSTLLAERTIDAETAVALVDIIVLHIKKGEIRTKNDENRCSECTMKDFCDEINNSDTPKSYRHKEATKESKENENANRIIDEYLKYKPENDKQ